MTRLGFVLLHRDSPGSIVRVRDLANALVQQGLEVYIMSPFDIGKMGFQGVFTVPIVGQIGRLVYSPVGGGFKKMLLHSKRGRHFVLRPEAIRRGIDFLSRTLARVGKKLQLDVIDGEQDIAAAAALKAADILGIRGVAGLHDIWREELLGTHKISAATDDFLYDLLTWTLDNADMTTVVSEAMRNRLVSHYEGNPTTIQVIPLGCRPRRDEVSHLDGKFPKIIHSGQISHYDNSDLLFHTVAFFKKLANWPFYLARKGEDIEWFEKAALQSGMDLDWYWFDDASRFYRFLCNCQIGVVTSVNHPTRHYGPAIKFYDYLACGIPVVANDIGGWTKEIEQHGIGVLTKSDPHRMASALLELGSDPEKCHLIGRRALTLAQTTYNIDRIAERLALLYAEL